MATETPEIPWLSDGQQISWRAFFEGASRLTEALTRDLEGDSSLSLNEYEVLVRLSENSAWTMRMSHLADSLSHSRSRVTHAVRRLEERGLVTRESCVIDGRGINAVLTDAGYAVLVDAAPKHVRSVRRYLVDVLTAEQLTVLGEAMVRVSAACRD